ncbi:MAG: ABC transporter substrate-binding protein [Chloroflexi bacterium]|nr:ABC transporter substrate-binding protein [Chloroflexota bacterium]
MKGKSTLASLVVLLALVALLPFSVIHADGHCEFADEAIKIGGLVPLSAPGSVAGGVAMSWAFNRAVDDINADCGVQIGGQNHRLQIVIGDSEGSPERGQAVVERFILEDEVHAVSGVYHSAVGLATMGILDANGIPTVFSEPWNDNVSANGIMEYDGRPPRNADGVDHIFRISPASSMVGGVVVDWLLAEGVDNVVIIAENTDYGQPAAADEKARFEAAGATVTQINVELGTEDFVPILSRIQASATVPDVVRILVTGETSYNLTQQMAELGIAPTVDTICVTNQFAFQSEQYWENVPDGNYCTFNRVGIIPSLFSDIAVGLNADYFEEFEDIIPSFAMASYDALHILADGMERAGTISDGAAIVAAIETTDLELSQGRYYFNYGNHNDSMPADDGMPDYFWHQWPDPVVTMMQYFEQGQSSLDAAVIFPEVYQTHGTGYMAPGEMP